MAQGTASPSPGEVTNLDCVICGEKMDVKRNVNGPTGFVEAMAHKSHLHDFFSCSFRDEMWHKQVYKLREAARNSVSQRLADIMLIEADEVLRDRKETKTISLIA